MFRKKYFHIICILVFIIDFHWIFYLNKKPEKQTFRSSNALEALQFLHAQCGYPNETIPDLTHYTASEYSKQNLLKKTSNKLSSVDPWYTITPHNLAGRTLAIAINPQNPNTIYAGSASGGLLLSISRTCLGILYKNYQNINFIHFAFLYDFC